MFSTVKSASVYGMEGRMVQVEADVSNGLPGFHMVGYLSTQVKEASERVRTALKNAGYDLPPKKITVNLSPADLKKSGSGFDLPIAVAVMAAYGKLPKEKLSGMMIAGELSLNGRVNGVPGILSMVGEAAKNGCRKCIIPQENAKEGAWVEEVEVIGVSTLKEALDYLTGQIRLSPEKRDTEAFLEKERVYPKEDFKDLEGQEAAKRAAEIAAAGFHNLLMIGPPGAGKSMIAKRIPGILPPLTLQESMEVTKIYSVRGELDEKGSLIKMRPFRSPHHTITAKAMAGGGNMPRPGEISLSHHGVLFLDELPEFSRETLEILRQPLENGYICISRTEGNYIFPSNMMLVAAMNPCPCGNYPDMNKCTCTYGMIRRYLGKISTPLLDRMDLTVEVSPVEYAVLKNTKEKESSHKIRKRVEEARRIQEERYQKERYRVNGELDQAGIEKYCILKKEEQDLMKEVFEKMDLTMRSYHRILRVARTIADLEACDNVEQRHLQEAVGYRGIGRKYWMGR